MGIVIEYLLMVLTAYTVLILLFYMLTKCEIGIMFRLASIWVGAHYSRKNKRICINLLPCVTVWFTFEGGRIPIKKYM